MEEQESTNRSGCGNIPWKGRSRGCRCSQGSAGGKGKVQEEAKHGEVLACDGMGTPGFLKCPFLRL